MTIETSTNIITEVLNSFKRKSIENKTKNTYDNIDARLDVDFVFDETRFLFKFNRLVNHSHHPFQQRWVD